MLLSEACHGYTCHSLGLSENGPIDGDLGLCDIALLTRLPSSTSTLLASVVGFLFHRRLFVLLVRNHNHGRGLRVRIFHRSGVPAVGNYLGRFVLRGRIVV